MKILDRILLLILKNRLRGYKRDSKWYEKEGNMNEFSIDNKGNYSDFYHTTGIPNLEKQIEELEKKINS